MSLTSHSQDKQRAPPGPRTNLDDLLFSLFRQKGIIVGAATLGLVAATVIYFLKPPLYFSQAKLLLHYKRESKGVDPKEIEILTSLDIATQVVARVGSERILARHGASGDSLTAAALVGSGIEVASSASPIITVTFKNRDEKVTQPVLDAIIHAYMLKHLEVFNGVGVLDEYWVKDLGEKLAQTDEQLNKAKAERQAAFTGKSTHPYEARISSTRKELDAAARDLAERRAALANEGRQPSALSSAPAEVPVDTLTAYVELVRQIGRLGSEERDLSRQGFKEAHPLVQTLRSQLRRLSAQKAELERDFPGLKQVTFANASRGTNSIRQDIATQLAEIKRLSARVAYLGTNLSNLQTQAAHVVDLEPKIAQLERQRASLSQSYDGIVTRLAKGMQEATVRDDNVVNISVVQNPSPPQLDATKTVQLAGGALLASIALGFGFALLKDRVLDRSIKTTTDVQRHLSMPVFLAIPDVSWDRRRGVSRHSGAGSGQLSESVPPRIRKGHMALVTGGDGPPLGEYAAGLRERVWTYFDVRDLEQKRPKLVAVAGCEPGAGASTLASGLAAELSRNGDGNVLLVDVSGKRRATHPFYLGRTDCGVNEVLMPEHRTKAQVLERLYLACVDEGTGADQVLVLCNRFNQFVPKLKASDYDYVVFDMPPVSPTSPTPRLAIHMYLTVLFVESERTAQRSAVRARDLMAETRANIVAVLNKCRRRVPAALSNDF